MASMGERSRPLGRYDWLAEALEFLGSVGVAGVRVERLAELLGVTKGSFYWHFQDRDDLLSSLLDYWETEQTDKICEQLVGLSGDAKHRLLAVLEHITKEEVNRYDAAVRAWALYDERAEAVVRRVDSKRLTYVRDLFLEMGFSPEQADVRSRMSYYYLVGEYAAFLDGVPKARRLQLVKLRHELLTAC